MGFRSLIEFDHDCMIGLGGIQALRDYLRTGNPTHLPHNMKFLRMRHSYDPSPLEWNPVETAPSDQWILVACDTAEIPDVAKWDSRLQTWIDCIDDHEVMHGGLTEYELGYIVEKGRQWPITHWKPLGPMPT